MKKIYHYTDLKAFYEIVDKKILYLTGLQNMNDKTEGSYAPEKFYEDVANCIYSVGEGLSESLSKALKKQLSVNKDKIISLCKYSGLVFSASFAQKRDSQLHWLAYADSAQGGCLCFNADKLKQKIANFSFLSLNSTLYLDKKRQEYIAAALNDVYSSIVEHLGISESNIYSSISKNFDSHLAAIYQSMKYFVKNTLFDIEDEIRLLFDESSYKNQLEFIKKKFLRFDTRHRK